MRKGDWVAAGVLAAAVASAVVAAGLPPTGWAEDSARLTIPVLPPAELKIPSLNATVRAVAERRPGEVVTVKLVCEGSTEHRGETVPLVVQVLRNDPRSMESRVAVPGRPVAKTECSLLIDGEGKGYASVELPLTWASEDSAGPEKGKSGPSYYLLLTSPLTPALVTLRAPEKVVQAGAQGAR